MGEPERARRDHALDRDDAFVRAASVVPTPPTSVPGKQTLVETASLGGSAASCASHARRLDEVIRSLVAALAAGDHQGALQLTGAVEQRAREASHARAHVRDDSDAARECDALLVRASQELATAEASRAAHGATAHAHEALPFLEMIQHSFGRHDVRGVRATRSGTSAAARAFAARAFAFGDRIAFATDPDLFTAAHEAAHVIQQRAGIDPGARDLLESHADLVADAVVAGRSAQSLLDRIPALGRAHVAIQHKSADAPSRSATAPVVPDLGDRGYQWVPGTYSLYVRAAWFQDALDFASSHGRWSSPTKIQELLAELKSRGMFAWVSDKTIAKASADLDISALTKPVDLIHIATSAFANFGLPPSTPYAISKRPDRGLDIVLAVPDANVAEGETFLLSPDNKRHLFAALTDFTKLEILPAATTKLVNTPLRFRFSAGVTEFVLDEHFAFEMFGKEAYKSFFDAGTDALDEGPHAGQQFGADKQRPPVFDLPIPARIDQRNGLIISGEEVDFTLVIDWPEAKSAEQKSEITWRPHRGHVEWLFERQLVPSDRGAAEHEYVQAGIDDHHDGSTKHQFTLRAHEDSAIWFVHAFVQHNYFRSAHLTTQVEVKTQSKRLEELRTQTFGDLGSPNIDHKYVDFKAPWYATLEHDVYNVGLGFHGTLPANFKQRTPAERKATLEEAILKQESLLEYLRNAGEKTAADACEHEIARLRDIESTLDDDTKAGWRPIDIRGFYLGRGTRVADGPLDLLATIRFTDPSVEVRIHDLSMRLAADDYVFTGNGESFEDALKSAFFDLCKKYPAGRVSILAETPGSATAGNHGTTVGFELAGR